MPSASLQRWRIERGAALDEIEVAHKTIGGTGRGRRYATQQLNHAYAVLLTSQFQGFCRDLHTECADVLVQGVKPAPVRDAFRDALLRNRGLDRGNPNPTNLGSDFSVFGVSFWADVRSLDQRNATRQVHLQALNDRRNAIAHHDFSKAPGGAILHIQQVRKWRAACDQLAGAFDEAMRRHLASLLGTFPW